MPAPATPMGLPSAGFKDPGQATKGLKWTIWGFTKSEPFFWSPANEDHSILGSLLGPLLYGNSQLGLGPVRPVRWFLIWTPRYLMGPLLRVGEL